MTEFLDIIENNQKRDSKPFVDKKSNESYKSQSQIGQNAPVQKTIYEATKEIVGKAIPDMDEGVQIQDFEKKTF